MTLVDAFHRNIDYLRISVTDRCNLRCLYCVPQGELIKLKHQDILRYEEILRIARIAISLGIKKIRITGGEPLVRKGIISLIESISALSGLQDISITTNGVLLLENLKRLWNAGIRRLNISLDTMKREKYRHITGSDKFDAVWTSIEKAADMGFDPIKINIVAMKNVNDDEIEDFGSLSMTKPYHIRFIEYMPIGTKPSRLRPEYIPSVEIKKRLEALGELEAISRSALDGPAERYRFEGAKGEIGLISPMTNHFCKACNRLRLTAAGSLRPCLLSSREIDIRGPLRNGATDAELIEIFRKAVMMKPSSHGMLHEKSELFPGEMSSIGG
ncbi:MAG: GTP 3',8-cyclase MoaA [Deltaproteobacteria bacterium]|nr:GTP 3',8-cyclase MoaA [Deltaproteobacteria bacterium]MBW2081777.1 GTP 3',8-cyclase MoaA [Deltaproteobacteria bacterium]